MAGAERETALPSRGSQCPSRHSGETESKGTGALDMRASHPPGAIKEVSSEEVALELGLKGREVGCGVCKDVSGSLLRVAGMCVSKGGGGGWSPRLKG